MDTGKRTRALVVDLRRRVETLEKLNMAHETRRWAHQMVSKSDAEVSSEICRLQRGNAELHVEYAALHDEVRVKAKMLNHDLGKKVRELEKRLAEVKRAASGGSDAD